MRRKVNPDTMSPAELDEYVQNLPYEAPPKMSSAGWLAAFAAIAIFSSVMRMNAGTYDVMTWLMLGGGILCLAGAGYIVYRVMRYRSIQ